MLCYQSWQPTLDYKPKENVELTVLKIYTTRFEKKIKVAPPGPFSSEETLLGGAGVARGDYYWLVHVCNLR